MAKSFRTNGVVGIVKPRAGAGGKFTLDELKSYIGGGYVEMVRLRDGTCMWCDEEGKLKGLPLNEAATAYVHAMGMLRGDVLVGDVLITEEGEVD